MRPGERHVVRTWLSDARLKDDSRLTDSEWLERYPVRYIADDRGRVVLHDFTLTASRFEDLGDLMGTYSDAGGTWFELDDGLVWDAQVDAAISNALVLDTAFRDGVGSSVTNSDVEAIGVFLRHLLAPTGPEEISRRVFDQFVERTPGYLRGDPLAPTDPNGVERLTDVQVANIKSAWSEALGAFDSIEGALGLRRDQEPLPEQVEVFVLRPSSTSRGLLVELPEALDLSRVEVQMELPGGSLVRPLVVPNANSTRLFIFDVAGGVAVPLADGTHQLSFTFHRSIGERNPEYSTLDGAPTESATLDIDLPGGEFTVDSTP